MPIADAAPATDLTRALGAVTVVADAQHPPIGDAVDGAAIDRSRALALAITVADLVGTMEGVLDTTCEYAKERHQYGVAIGSFQAVQHLLAEARVLVEGFDQLAAVRGVGRRRAATGRGAGSRRGRQGLLRARRPHGV